jgi:hypothetical protein
MADRFAGMGPAASAISSSDASAGPGSNPAGFMTFATMPHRPC